MYTPAQLRAAYLAERKRQQGNRAAQQRAYREYRRGLSTIALFESAKRTEGVRGVLYMPVYWPRWMALELQTAMRELTGVR